MWRYILMAVSVAGAATQYPLLFQQKADEDYRITPGAKTGTAANGVAPEQQ
ncbi:MAG: hypothetical protein R3D29_01425 [Nitratireductor sp.]